MFVIICFLDWECRFCLSFNFLKLSEYFLRNFVCRLVCIWMMLIVWCYCGFFFFCVYIIIGVVIFLFIMSNLFVFNVYEVVFFVMFFNSRVDVFVIVCWLGKIVWILWMNCGVYFKSVWFIFRNSSMECGDIVIRYWCFYFWWVVYGDGKVVGIIFSLFFYK